MPTSTCSTLRPEGPAVEYSAISSSEVELLVSDAASSELSSSLSEASSSSWRSRRLVEHITPIEGATQHMLAEPGAVLHYPKASPVSCCLNTIRHMLRCPSHLGGSILHLFIRLLCPAGSFVILCLLLLLIFLRRAPFPKGFPQDGPHRIFLACCRPGSNLQIINIRQVALIFGHR